MMKPFCKDNVVMQGSYQQKGVIKFIAVYPLLCNVLFVQFCCDQFIEILTSASKTSWAIYIYRVHKDLKCTGSFDNSTQILHCVTVFRQRVLTCSKSCFDTNVLRLTLLCSWGMLKTHYLLLHRHTVMRRLFFSLSDLWSGPWEGNWGGKITNYREGRMTRETREREKHEVCIVLDAITQHYFL